MRATTATGTIAVLVLATGSAALARPADADTGGDSRPPAARADRDADGLDDALEHQLDGRHPHELVDVIVQVRPEVAPRAVRTRHGIGPGAHDLGLAHGFAGRVTVAQARALARAPEVVRVQDDGRVSVVLRDSQADTGTDRARRAYGLDGTGVGVCVVDTGVDPLHEQLDGHAPIPFFDAVGGQAVAYDDQGHGTHVAGIVAGDGDGGPAATDRAGVAPGVTLYAAKVLSADGTGTESQILAGMDWCVAQPGVDVMSMSLGTTTASDGQDALSQAVDAAVAEGVVVVVAAGNGGSNRQTVGAPGAAVGALTVGASATWSGPLASATPGWYGRPLLGGVYLAPFSSRGPTLATDGTAATRRTKPDVVAPGVHVVSAAANSGDGYASGSGTSMATPFVSGAVALALQADPSLTPDEVRHLVARTAHDRGWPGKDDDWGHGLLDGWAFVATAAGDADAATPTRFPGHGVSGTVADGANTWTHAFEVEPGVPVAVTVLIAGAWAETCWFPGFCLEEWTLPDLDARLVAADGTVVDTSTCGLGCGDGTQGTQETLTAMPTAAGTWRLEVFPFDDGAGGDFVADLSHGPVGGGDLNHPTRGRDDRVAIAVHVNELTESAVQERGRWAASVQVAVADAASAAVAVPVEAVGHWDDGTRAACLTSGGTCTVERHGLAMRTQSVAFTVDALRSTEPGTIAWDRDADRTRGVVVQRP